VPSGNFGNLTGGLIAKKMGLPVEHFIAATNINDIVPEYLHTNIFSPRASKQTISNAMDVGNPSNFARMLDLYENDFSKLTSDISGKAFADDETKDAIREVFSRYRYTMDPHGAIGYLGLQDYLYNHKDMTGIFFETAHPGKFGDVVEDALKREITLPDTLLGFMRKDKLSIRISSQFEDFRKFITENF
jgi:threonine synthase